MSYNVLIIDDSASMRAIIAKALRLSGLELGEVHMAENGIRALEVLDEQWVDVVLADLNMPEMGGIELIERMRHKGMTGRVPVVVVSTEGRREIIDGLLELGAAAFLRKPFAPEQLGLVIDSVLADPVSPDDAVLVTAFYEAVEGFAMLVAEPAFESVPAPEEAIVARVAFVGPGATGTISLASCPDACMAIGRSATGGEVVDGSDALAELANVTAGQLVDRLSSGPFGLCPPEVLACPGNEAWSRVAGSERFFAFQVEGHSVVAGFDLRKRW